MILIFATFFAVILLTKSIFDILDKSSEEYKKKYVSQAVDDFESMFIYISPNQLFFLNIAITAIILILAIMMFDTWTFRILVAFVGFFVPGKIIKIIKRKRLEKFNRQLVDALIQMANAFKAGLSFPQAMQNISEEGVPPLSLEFELALKEIKLGVSIEEALVNMAKRVHSEDLDLVVISTNIARQMGGNMSEMYDTISTTIRERFRLQGKIASLVSQGKLQGFVVGAMPIILGLVLSKMRPDLMEPMMESWFGVFLVIGIAILEFLGALVIRKIISIDV
jgi:tight adherence protein B